jgi:hypothetical protein
VDPTKDKRINGSFYGITVSPSDGTVWGTILGFPGGIARLSPGSNPPATALTEYYELPRNNPKARVQGYSPRGLDIDTNGVVWTVLSSGHFASFDRSKCKGPLNGPNATGQQCPEGWTLYPFPGPQLKGVTDSGSADASYYNWVDQFDTLGLGKNTPIAAGSGSDSLLALVNGKYIVMRVPYPLNFYVKGLDGRIDDTKAAGRAKACGPPAALALLSTPRPARGRPPRSTTSSSGQIRWRARRKLNYANHSAPGSARGLALRVSERGR